MKGWKSYILWEGLPIFMLLAAWGFLSLINWDYESKLLDVNHTAANWSIVYMGPLFLGTAVFLTSFASFILFIVRQTRPQQIGQWYMFVCLTLTTIFFVFPSLFLVFLGPSVITIFQQMQQTPST